MKIRILIAGIAVACAVSACGSEQSFQPAGIDSYTVSQDGRTLTLYSSNGGCRPLDHKKVVETDAAVTIDLASTLPDGTSCGDVGRPDTATVSLKSPLGQRTVVDANDTITQFHPAPHQQPPLQAAPDPYPCGSATTTWSPGESPALMSGKYCSRLRSSRAPSDHATVVAESAVTSSAWTYYSYSAGHPFDVSRRRITWVVGLFQMSRIDSADSAASGPSEADAMTSFGKWAYPKSDTGSEGGWRQTPDFVRSRPERPAAATLLHRIQTAATDLSTGEQDRARVCSACGSDYSI